MNPIVSHLISGRVLYSGLGLMLVCLLSTEFVQSPRLRRLLAVQAWVGALLAVCTAALPFASIAILAGGLVGWTALSLRGSSSNLRRRCLGFVAVYSLGLLLIEFPKTRVGTIPSAKSRALVVIGDSLSAGLGEGEGTPWPTQLGDLHKVRVANLSEPGATTRDGIEKARLAKPFPGLVILELGGNDLLGGRSVSEFEADLSQILQTLSDQQRSVVLVELPLLPGKNAWGVVQRRLARKYGCSIIPKRLLVDVLAAPGATVDTLHLSEAGHKRLAETIWQVIGHALPPAPPVPEPTRVEPVSERPVPPAPAVVTSPPTKRVPTLDEMILFQPSRTGDWSPANLVYRDVDFSAADGTQLHGWYCPADAPRAVVLYCHGNAGNIAWMARFLEHLRSEHQLSILAFDYRGYGKSQGLPTADGVVSDGRAARIQLAELSGIPVRQQLIWGRSMGGAVAVQLAADEPARGLVLECTFDSFKSVATHHAPAWAFAVPAQRLNSISRIREIACPLLQIHGTADRVVPFPMGQALFEAAVQPKQFVEIPGADHNSPVPPSIYRMIDEFIDRRCQAPQ